MIGASRFGSQDELRCRFIFSVVRRVLGTSLTMGAWLSVSQAFQPYDERTGRQQNKNAECSHYSQ